MTDALLMIIVIGVLMLAVGSMSGRWFRGRGDGGDERNDAA